MKRSDERILTTHAGSLPRPAALVDLLARANRREPVEAATLEAEVARAVPAVVALQRDVGIDVGNDGEQGRESFFTYVQHRMSGFGGAGETPRVWQDIADFPGYLEVRSRQRSAHTQVSLVRPPRAVDEVRYGDTAAVEADCARLAAAAGAPGGAFTESFLTSPSPGIIATAMANAYYPSLEDYVAAVADALAVEYRCIVDAGFVLQIDAPDLAMEHHGLFAGRPLSQFLDFVDLVVGAVNRALEGIPAERVRLHVCWGNYGGPHVHDVALADLLGHLYEARVGGLLLSMANPRHEHEYRELARNPLPAGMVLAAGVIDVTTNYVEHPEVVADRLERVAEAVGDPHRVLACTDCGFDTAAGFGLVAADVAWEKLRSLRDGAALATARLF
ncbi:MAG: methionine synthase [Acidimicrobiia bacterium]|nr:methionine synthase [Acidimicrobiia bacterium]